MDTIGDAYVAAGLLNSLDPAEATERCDTLFFFAFLAVFSVISLRSETPSGHGRAAADGHGCWGRCAAMIRLSQRMLKVLERHREVSGKDLRCRIGISTGEVYAGVLGRLQPRCLHLRPWKHPALPFLCFRSSSGAAERARAALRAGGSGLDRGAASFCP
jgi:class 3 adenylate cyclase